MCSSLAILSKPSKKKFAQNSRIDKKKKREREESFVKKTKHENNSKSKKKRERIEYIVFFVTYENELSNIFTVFSFVFPLLFLKPN